MQFTIEQNEAISCKNNTLLVSAAAGAGKTAVLVNRIFRMLIEEEKDISRLLVLTFTHAAANELKARIRNKLYEESSQKPQLYDQLNRMVFSHIQTLHTFCGETAREFFQVSGVNPLVKTCSVQLSEKLKDEAIDRALIECCEDPSECMMEFIRAYSDRERVELIQFLYNKIISFAQPTEWLCANCALREDGVAKSDVDINQIYSNAFEKRNVFIESSCRVLEKKLAELQQLAENADFPEKYQSVPLNDTNDINLVIEKCRNKDESAAYYINNLKLQTKPSIRNRNETEEYYSKKIDEIRTVLKSEVRNTLASYYSENDSQMIDDISYSFKQQQGLAQMTLRYYQIYSQLKREANVIDFNDMEHMALKVLNDSYAKKIINSRFDAIFIDECQDNSGIQDAILTTLHSIDNSLFMVGDVKQSIYRFRNAEPEIFIKKMHDFSMSEDSQNRKILLNKNFRSSPLILDSVNRVFNTVMREDCTELPYKPGEDWLEPGRKDKKAKTVNLAIINDVSNSRKDKIEVQAAYIAKKIKSLYGTKINNCKNPIKYSDIAILCSKMKGVDEVVAKVFENAEIPLQTQAKKSDVIEIESEQVLSFIETLLNPTNDIALLTVLRGPLFGLSDNSLAKIRMEFPATDISYADAFYMCAEKADSYGALPDEDIGEFSQNKSKYSTDKAKLDEFIKKLKDESITEVLSESEKEDEKSSDQNKVKYSSQWSSEERGGTLRKFKDSIRFQDRLAELPEDARNINITAEQFSIWALCADIRRVLSQEKFLLHNMVLDKYIWSLIMRSELYNDCMLYTKGKQRQFNLIALCTRAVNFVADGGVNPLDFVDDCRALHEKGEGLEPITISSKQDCVRIMSIHKSKGLEFPILFVIGLEKKIHGHNSSYNLGLHSNFGMALNYRRPEIHVKRKTVVKSIMEKINKDENTADKARLLYVAMTRAKEQLFLVGSDDFKKTDKWFNEDNFDKVSNASSMLDWICSAIAKGNDAKCLLDEKSNSIDNELNTESCFDISDNHKFLPWKISCEKFDGNNDYSKYLKEEIFDISEEENQDEDELTIKKIMQDVEKVVVDEKELIKNIYMEKSTFIPEQFDRMPQNTTVTSVSKVLQEREDKLIKQGLLKLDNSYINISGIAEVPEPCKLPFYRPQSIMDEAPKPAFMLENEKVSAARRGTVTHLIIANVNANDLREFYGSYGNDYSGGFRKSLDLHSDYDFYSTKNYSAEMIAEAKKELDGIDKLNNKIAVTVFNIVEKAANKLLYNGIIDVDELNAVDLRTIASFYTSDIAIRFLNSKAAFREHNFTLNLPGWEPSVLEGTIDMCFVENGEWVIVDYKTDKKEKENFLKHRYKKQLELYGISLNRITAHPVKECYLYILVTGEALRM